jgi:methylated-DNA-[protein]-cysteine S-methyltransferase
MTETFTTHYRSPIGLLEITGGEQGIASISFVDDAIDDGESPHALRECIAQLDEYFSGRRKEFSIALDLRGTEFQERVWRELQKIPFGRTVSYLDVAMAVGTKESTRAVGRANGQNPIAIIVPCHRVIGSDGSLTGYGGGLWRKRGLLDFETGAPQPSLFAPALEPHAVGG